MKPIVVKPIELSWGMVHVEVDFARSIMKKHQKLFGLTGLLVLLAVCLISCLLPLAWLRNASRGKIEKTQAPENHLKG